MSLQRIDFSREIHLKATACLSFLGLTKHKNKIEQMKKKIKRGNNLILQTRGVEEAAE